MVSILFFQFFEGFVKGGREDSEIGVALHERILVLAFSPSPFVLFATLGNPEIIHMSYLLQPVSNLTLSTARLPAF